MTHQRHGTAFLLPSVDIGRIYHSDLHSPVTERHPQTSTVPVTTRAPQTSTVPVTARAPHRAKPNETPQQQYQESINGEEKQRRSGEAREQYCAAAPLSRSISPQPKPLNRQIVPKRRGASLGGQAPVWTSNSLPLKRVIDSLETRGNSTEDRDVIRLKRFKRAEEYMQAGISEIKAKETALQEFPDPPM